MKNVLLVQSYTSHMWKRPAEAGLRVHTAHFLRKISSVQLAHNRILSLSGKTNEISIEFFSLFSMVLLFLPLNYTEKISSVGEVFKDECWKHATRVWNSFCSRYFFFIEGMTGHFLRVWVGERIGHYESYTTQLKIKFIWTEYTQNVDY